MSVRIMGEVWELDLPPSKQHVLLALADHADHNGDNVYPSLKLIAWKTGYSDRHVRRIVNELRKDGLLIEVEKRSGNTTKYRINTMAGQKKSAYDPCQDVMGQDVSPDMGVIPPLDSDVIPPLDMGVMGGMTPESYKPSVKPSIEPSEEPSVKESVASDDALVKPASSPASKNLDEPVDKDVKSDTTDDSDSKQRNKDIAAILKAHLDSGVIWAKKKPIYSFDSYRVKAEALLDNGVTPQQVRDYIHYLQTRPDDDFWHDKSVSLEHILKNIKSWLTARERDIEDDEPPNPAHVRYIAPDDEEEGDPVQRAKVWADMQKILNKIDWEAPIPG